MNDVTRNTPAPLGCQDVDAKPAAAQEPIGYRWRHSASEAWQYSNFPCGWEHQPLYAAPVTAAQEAVAYLDIGAGGYIDLGSDLSDEQLLALPKGRHALAIIGTFGIDGYVAAPVTAAPVDLDALAVNRYRPVPDGLLAYKVVAGDGTRSLFSGTMNECNVVARKLTEAFLDGAHVVSTPASSADSAVLTNPYTGQPRDYRDVESDPAGTLIVEPGKPLEAASTPAAPGIDLAGLRAIAGDLSQSAKVDDYEPHQIAFIESIRDRLLALIDAGQSNCWPEGSYAERVERLMGMSSGEREAICARPVDSPKGGSEARAAEAMADEYQKWIDFYHRGVGDYGDFLRREIFPVETDGKAQAGDAEVQP